MRSLPFIPVLCGVLGLGAPRAAGESALRFEGAQALISPPAPLGPHTLEAWVRPEGALPAPGSPAVVIDWDQRARLTVSSTSLVYSLELSGRAPARVAALPPALGEWRHVAAGYDGARVFIAVDGKIEAFALAPGAIAGSAEGPLAFGGRVAGGAGEAGFRGWLDDLRLWKRARAPAEIEESLGDHLDSPSPDLLSYWDLDDAAGQAAADAAGARPAVLGDLPAADPRDPRWTSEHAPVRKPSPGYTLGFGQPGPLSMGTGEAFTLACTLSALEAAPDGELLGWAIAVRHDRASLVLEDVSLVATAADQTRADGFAVVEYLDNGARSGFISRVLFSQSGGAVLPPSPSLILARARYRGSLNLAAGARGAIRFDDRLPPGEEGPAENQVLARGGARLPAEGKIEVDLQAPRFALALEPPRLAAAPGKEIAVAAALTTAENRASSGASSWSFGVAHDPEVLELLEVVTAGTALDRFARNSLFLVTEEVRNGTGTGFVTVAILNLTEPLALPPNGEETLVRARYRVRPEAPLGKETAVAFKEGLVGSGAPIDIHVDFIGGSARPEVSDLALKVARTPFLRGDPNADRRANIADAVFVLKHLFQSGAAPRCLDAADLNDDGRINIADPVYLLKHLFQSGAPPPVPYPQAGEDPTGDALDCAEAP